MSITPAADRVSAEPAAAAPRVRHLAREAVAVMAFSALTSASLAACLVILGNLGRQV